VSLNFQQIKADFPIEKVVELLALDVTKQRNGQLRGICPIHDGNDPRGFVVTPARNLWYCFKSCGGGDQLALIAKVRKCSPKQAAEWLTGDVGGTSTHRAEPSSGTVPESGSFLPLTYLEADHEAVTAVGLEPEIAELIGAGYAPRGTMKGSVLVPIRLPTGELIGYLGVTECLTPQKWHLPTQKVVSFPKKARQQ
jgi:DNA primase